MQTRIFRSPAHQLVATAIGAAVDDDPDRLPATPRFGDRLQELGASVVARDEDETGPGLAAHLPLTRRCSSCSKRVRIAASPQSRPPLSSGESEVDATAASH